MKFRFSTPVASSGPSPVADVLKLSTNPDLISFAAGNPSSDAFPYAAVEAIAAKVLAENPASVLQYSRSQGSAALLAALRPLLENHYKAMGPEDNLVVVSGAQQGAKLTAQIFCDPGDVVICEDPSFMGCLAAFRGQGAKLVGVPMDEDGIDTTILEEKLKENRGTRFIYLIPTFQNPTGITMSLEKRKKVYELAVAYDVLVLEDNPYGDLRIQGETIPPIKSFDTTGHVIYLGSFSKILAPGVRVGFVCAHRDVVRELISVKQSDDVHSNLLAQTICEQFITQYDLDAHIEGLQAIYRRKCQKMLTAMDRHFNPKVTYTRPEGGLFLWATLPVEDSTAFCKLAVERGVAVVPGIAFAAQEGGVSPSFRLNFSTPSDEAIERGIEILGKLTYELF